MACTSRYLGYCVTHVQLYHPDIDVRVFQAEVDLEEAATLLLEKGEITEFFTQFPLHCESRTRPLRADGRMVLSNGQEVFIEVDGPQHFAVDGFKPFSSDPERRESLFRDQMARDRLKDRHIMAERGGASLLRISYKEYSSVGSLLMKFVRELNNGTPPHAMVSNAELYGQVGFEWFG